MQGRADAEFLALGTEDGGAHRSRAGIAPLADRTSPISAPVPGGRARLAADRLRVGLQAFPRAVWRADALVAAGGVAANQAIRGALDDVAVEAGTR